MSTELQPKTLVQPKTFEEWAERELGAEVFGVNDAEWRRCQECWETAQLALMKKAEEGYDEYWEREYANYNVDGANRGFGEVVWRDARLKEAK